MPATRRAFAFSYFYVTLLALTKGGHLEQSEITLEETVDGKWSVRIQVRRNQNGCWMLFNYSITNLQTTNAKFNAAFPKSGGIEVIQSELEHVELRTVLTALGATSKENIKVSGVAIRLIRRLPEAARKAA